MRKTRALGTLHASVHTVGRVLLLSAANANEEKVNGVSFHFIYSHFMSLQVSFENLNSSKSFMSRSCSHIIIIATCVFESLSI